MTKKKVKLELPLQPSFVTSVSGLPKTGKTRFSFTYPEPIKCFSFDGGADYIRTKFPDKEITIQNFRLPVLDTEKVTWAEPIWEEFYAQYNEDVESGQFKTITLDTATVIQSMLRQFILENLQVSKPSKQKLSTNEYLARNLVMKAMFDRAKYAGVHRVTIQYLAEKLLREKGSDKAEPTGEMILQGWGQTEGYADLNIEMATKMKANKKVMVATIKSCRFTREFDGQSFEDPTFYEITALIFGGE